MKRRTFALFVVMAMGALSACGDKDNTTAVSSSTVEQIKDYADDYGIEVTVESTEDIVIVIDETITEETDVSDEDEEIVEETEEETEEVEEIETTKTGGSSGSTNNSQPAHTHNWIEHTTTEQVWVPHIVVVDDYEYRVIGRTDDVAICDCGFTTSDSSVMESHVMNHILAQENSGFTIQAGHDIVEQVKVGSHEEDYGHYETQTYVDYYYCECGERK